MGPQSGQDPDRPTDALSLSMSPRLPTTRRWNHQLDAGVLRATGLAGQRLVVMMLGTMVGAAVISAGLSGCVRSQVTDPVPTEYDRNDPAGEVVFMHNLASATRVSNGEALHALSLLAFDEDPTTNYVDRVERAKAAGWLDPNFDSPAEEVTSKGMIADCLVRMLRIDDSIMLKAFGPTPRYALRELVALGVMPSESSAQQAISGAEFVGVLGRARDEAISRRMRQMRKATE